ncbi:hypothetical protein ACLK19_10315 [Escherichia coli]
MPQSLYECAGRQSVLQFFPNWLAWDFLPAVATAHDKRVDS